MGDARKDAICGGRILHCRIDLLPVGDARALLNCDALGVLHP